MIEIVDTFGRPDISDIPKSRVVARFSPQPPTDLDIAGQYLGHAAAGTQGPKMIDAFGLSDISDIPDIRRTKWTILTRSDVRTFRTPPLGVMSEMSVRKWSECPVSRSYPRF
jgi:hypothetical protein